MPGLAVHDDLSLFLANQLFGALGGGFRHYHGYSKTQAAPGVSYGDTGVAT
ncbi:hypothetical protein D3C77_817480 [compost metagenome]